MSCMKCGKAAEDGQAFCARCLEVMEQYPVKSDVLVQLPVRTEASPKKQTHKPRLGQKIRIARLQRQIRWMWAVIILLVIALIIVAGRETVVPQEREPGQNYTYTEPTT